MKYSKLAYRKKIKEIWLGPIRWGVPLSEYTTLRVGGPAQALIEPEGRDELATLVGGLEREKIPWHIIGRGSNLLVTDRGVTGVVIVMSKKFAQIRHLAQQPAGGVGTTDDNSVIEVEAGCTLANLLRWCKEEELSGLEFLAGIPGSVGGAIAMNAGAMGHEICDLIEQVTMLDMAGKIIRQKMQVNDAQYRKWYGRQGRVIISGHFVLCKEERETIAKRCADNVAWRKKKQPQASSAGSFFKNPHGLFAGRLIEEAGLKGLRVGGAEVSKVHANFIVNQGQASAADIFELVAIIQEKVQINSGVWLVPEVESIGD